MWQFWEWACIALKSPCRCETRVLAMVLRSEKSKIEANYCLLFIVSFSQSFILIFSNLLANIGVSSLQQVFFRIILAIPPVFFLARYKSNLNLRELIHFAPSGFVFAAFIMSGLSAVAIGTAIAVTIGLIYTQPLFTTILAAISGRERISWKHVTIIFVGVIGALLVSGILNGSLSSNKILGVVLALSGGVWYSVYLFLKRGVRTNLNPMQGMLGTLLFAAPSSLIIGWMLRFVTSNLAIVGFSNLNVQQFVLLLGLGLVCTALPYSTLNHVKKNLVSPTTEGTLLLLDPVFHTVWAVIFFQQFLSYIQYLGFTLIIVSAVLTMRVGMQGSTE